MKKELRSLLAILLIVSIGLGCKLSQVQPSATPIPATPTENQASIDSPTTTSPPLPTAVQAQADTPTALPVEADTPTAIPTQADTPTATRVQTATPTTLPLPTLTLPTSPQSAGDAYAPELGNSGYDVQAYNLRLDLDPASATIAADVTITATTTSQIQQVSLDFIGYEIQTITFLGLPLEYHRQANKLLVDLPTTLPTGEQFVLEIAYSGEPVIEASAYIPFVPHIGLIRPDNESLFVASEPDGSRYWFPCNDHPRDKATYRFELTVPEGMTGVANGQLVSGPVPAPGAFPGGKDGETFTWAHNYPVATAFVTVAVANYVRVEGRSPKGIPLRSYVFPDEVDRFQAFEADIGEMVDWMGDRFGTYPFEAFGYVMVKDLGASLETQSMVVLDRNMLNEETLVHELAHMWFGDWVSLASWGDIWRSEGFATYIQFMWVSRNQPDQLNQTIQGIEEMYAQHPSDYPLNYPPRAEMFGSDSYVKGAVVVSELRALVGDDAFFGGLRTYFELFGGGVASQAQFQAVMEAASGMKLDDFFAKWFQ